MKTETSYSHVKLPPNTIAGATVTALSAKQGTTLTRVTENGRDDLQVRVEGNPRRSFDLDWSNVKGASQGAWQKKDRKAKTEDVEAEDDPSVVPVNDAVRVTKPKK